MQIPTTHLAAKVVAPVATTLIGLVAFAGPASASGNTIAKEDFKQICEEAGGVYDDFGDAAACWGLPGDTDCYFDGDTNTMYCVLRTDESDTPASTDIETPGQHAPASESPVVTGTTVGRRSLSKA